MADLRTDTGRNRRVWLYALPLTILLQALAGGVPPALGQVGPELTGPMSPMTGAAQTGVPPAANQMAPPPAAGQVAPPTAGPAGPPPGDSLAAAAPPETVVRVMITGLRSLPLSKVQPHIKTRAGRPYDPEMIQEDVRRLHHTGLFVDVKPCSQVVPGGRIVVFNLQERPLLTDVLFIGCQEIRKKTLQREAKLKAGDPVDPMAIEEARRKLEEYYHEHGFNGARLTLLEGDRPEDRRAVFLVNEGTKQKVWNTAFIGNTIAGDDLLRTKLSTSRPFLWLFGGEFDRKKLDEDVEKLTAYYRSLGFFRARIGHPIPEFNEKRNWVTITFVIDEGPRFKIRNVSVIGNTKFTSDVLLADMKLVSGDYFNQAKMTADRLSLVDKYGGIGYVFADIRPDPRFLEEPAELDLVYNIKEGGRYRVGKINIVIKGDYPHTQLTTVLNRLSLKPGDIVDIREIRASERRIKASQLFEVTPGNAPKIVFNPPGQETQDDEEVPDKPKTKTGSGGGRRGMGRGFGGGSPSGDDSDSSPTYRGQSPDPPSRDRAYEITYAVPIEESEIRGQGSAVGGQGSADRLAAEGPLPPPNACPSQWAGSGAGAENDALAQRGRALSQALAQGRIDRSGTILTQYSPNAGQVNPASQPSAQWPGNPPASDQTYAGPPQAPAPVYGQPNPNQPPPSQPPTQPAPAQPAPAYGQQMWPNQGQQRPVNSPEGPYVPGPIFSEDSPFRGGPPDGGEPARLLDFGVISQEAMTGRVMVGVGINSEAGLVGSVVLDEQNFDWTRWPTSWEDIRDGTWLRGRGQRFRLEAAPSIATTPGTQPLQRYMVTFQDPYLFDSQVGLSLSGFYFNRVYTQYTDERLGGRIGLGYQFTPDLSGGIAYTGEKINISNPVDPLLPALAEVTGRDLAMHGFQVSLTQDKRDNAFLATEGHLIQASFEEVIGSYQYPKVEIDARKYFTLYQRPDGSGRQVLSLSAHAGLTGDSTPIYDRYYAGGFSSLRGFQFRGVSPTVYDPVNGITTAVGGDFEMLASAEYLFPITADDMLRGVVFCDSGTVEPTVSNWSNKYRVAPGFGLRIVVPAMGPAPIALDFAFPVSWQPGDTQEMFSFFVGFGR